jgi:hypothetical protein
MKRVLFAAAAAALIVGVARAEGPNAVEMPGGISRPVLAGQSGADAGSERMPLFSGAAQHSPPNPVISDVGSEALPVWALARPVAMARK